MTFMWTFEGVMQAIGLGFVLLVFFLFGLVVLIDSIQRRIRKAQEK